MDFSVNTTKTSTHSVFVMALFSTLLRSIGPLVHAYLMLFSSWQAIALIEAIALTGFYFIACSGKGWLPGGITGWVIALLNVVGTVLFFLSLRAIGPLDVTLWVRNQSLFTMLLAIIFLGERHSFLMWFAISLSLLGSFLFSYSPDVAMPSLYNLLLLLGFCVSLALRNFLIKLYPRYNAKELMLQGSWLQLALLIFLVPFSDLNFAYSQIFTISAVAILCHGLSMTLFIEAARSSTLSQVTAIRAIGPVFTFLLGFAIFPKHLSFNELLGAILCLFSILLMALKDLKKRRIIIYGSSNIDNL